MITHNKERRYSGLLGYDRVGNRQMAHILHLQSSTLEERGTRFLQNIGNYLINHMVSHPKRTMAISILSLFSFSVHYM